MTPLTMLQSQYQKALRCFLLTKYSAAAIACVKTIALLPPSSDQSFSDISVQQIEQLRFSIWTLYLNIATTLLARDNPSTQTIELLGLPPSTATHKDQVALQVWQFLMNHYGGSGNVDPRLISTCILMTIKLQVVNAGRHIAEEWYAGLSDATMDYFAAITAQEDPQEPNVYYEGTLKALELYITQILPALKDYESAISFCEYNPLIRESNKKTIYRAIQDHKEAAAREKERKLDEQKKAEERARLSRERERARREAEECARNKANAVKDAKATSLAQERFANGLPSPALSASSLESQDEEDRVSGNSLSALDQRRRGEPVFIKEWLSRALTTGKHSALGAIFLVLILIGVLRGSRGQWPRPIKVAFVKLWQTIQMGTKVTYM